MVTVTVPVGEGPLLVKTEMLTVSGCAVVMLVDSGLTDTVGVVLPAELTVMETVVEAVTLPVVSEAVTVAV